jgi:hypothetical protein
MGEGRADRKSAFWGKGVPVGLDCGGGGVIKKKKKEKNKSTKNLE